MVEVSDLPPHIAQKLEADIERLEAKKARLLSEAEDELWIGLIPENAKLPLSLPTHNGHLNFLDRCEGGWTVFVLSIDDNGVGELLPTHRISDRKITLPNAWLAFVRYTGITTVPSQDSSSDDDQC
jgi:hypothetical protein